MKIIYEAHFGGGSKATIISEGPNVAKVLEDLNKAIEDMPKAKLNGNVITTEITDQDGEE